MHPSLTIFCAESSCNYEYCGLNLMLQLLGNPFIIWIFASHQGEDNYLILEGPKKFHIPRSRTLLILRAFIST